MAGVDEVGVGGVGMLHHPQTGRNKAEKHGPYMEENIPQVNKLWENTCAGCGFDPSSRH
jgi:hypothetical protein